MADAGSGAVMSLVVYALQERYLTAESEEVFDRRCLSAHGWSDRGADPPGHTEPVPWTNVYGNVLIYGGMRVEAAPALAIGFPFSAAAGQVRRNPGPTHNSKLIVSAGIPSLSSSRILAFAACMREAEAWERDRWAREDAPRTLSSDAYIDFYAVTPQTRLCGTARVTRCRTAAKVRWTRRRHLSREQQAILFLFRFHEN